jgi:type VI secretion system secreted protein VgrG
MVRRIEGRCRVNELYHFDVHVVARATDHGHALGDALVGQRAQLGFPDEVPPRVLHGLCSSVRWLGVTDLGEHGYVMRIVPQLWLLSQRQQSRVFQDIAVPEVLRRVLAGSAVAARFELARDYPLRVFCVQYRETDLAFCMRLCAEEGMFFFFEHGLDGETLVIADEIGAVRDIAGVPLLRVRLSQEGQAVEALESDVQVFEPGLAVRTSTVHLRQRDFERPLLRHVASSPLAGAPSAFGPPETLGLEHYDHHEDYENIAIAADDARIRAEQLRRERVHAQGRTQCRRLLPGQRFHLTDHPVDACNRGWTVTSLDFHATAAALAGESPTFVADFHVVPDDMPPRPLPTERRLQHAVETATVVGPAGEDIYTDVLGRIRVQFHWDREGRFDGGSSCWIRHTETWAGAGWGSQFIPRVGMEVLVSFVGGDVDRPLVIGAVANAAMPVPFTLPEHKTKSGIRTASSPGGGGYNELTFEDRSGEEKIHLRAEKDLVLEAKGSLSQSAGAGRSAVVAGDDHLSAQERSAVISGGDRLEVDENRSVKVRGDQDVEIVGNSTLQVGGTRRCLLRGGGHLEVYGTFAARVAEDCTLSIGSGGEDSAAQVSVAGQAILESSRTLTLVAAEGLRIVCGDSTVEITPERVAISAKNIDIAGSEGVTALSKGPSLSMQDKLEVSAKEVRIYSEDGAIEMDKEVRLRGKTLKLNCSTDSPEVQEQGDELKTKKLALVLTDFDLAPYAGKKYLVVAGGKRVEGETDGSGKLEVDVPEDALVAEVTLWVGEYPTGDVRHWSVRLEDMPPANDNAGALQRLTNLGYHAGVVEDEPAEEVLRAALEWFQQDQQIEITGVLDAATVAALEKAHGY